MKIQLLLATAVLAFATTASAAELTDVKDINPYVGAGYSYTDADYKNDFDLIADTDHHAAFVAAGVRPHKYWGAEAFYQLSTDTDKSVDTTIGSLKTETSFQAFGIDALGYLPLNEKVELVGSLGVGHYRFKAQYSGLISDTEKENNLGWRIGAGAQYHLNDTLSVRGMLRYVDLNDGSSDAVKNLTDFSIGLFYRF